MLLLQAFPAAKALVNRIVAAEQIQASWRTSWADQRGPLMGEYQLAQAMLPLSVAASWQQAKLEWTLAEVYRQDEPETCLCGHYPIIEICVLENKKNGNRAEVGNVCVKKFLGLPSDRIFQAIRRVAVDPVRALNAETIHHAHQRRWITDWERNFYLDTIRKRLLSEKQAAKRLEINYRVLQATRRTRGTGTT